MGFGQGYANIPWGTLPYPDLPNNDIALFGSDMYLNNYGADAAVYYQTFNDPDLFVVQFVNLHYCCSSNTPHTFEVVLFANGDILAQYQALNGTATAYVGIENGSGADGLGYSGTLADQLAIRYYYPVGVFLSPTASEGYGRAGTHVTYDLEVINQTGSPDSFKLSALPGYAWPTNLSLQQTPPLADGERAAFSVDVAIPTGVAPGTLDAATIRAVSINAPTVYSATVAVTTTVTSEQMGYVAQRELDRVAVVDPVLHRVMATIDVGAVGCYYPWRAEISPIGDFAVIACYDSGGVAVIDTTTQSVSYVVSGINLAADVAFTHDGQYALVGSQYAPQLTVVNLKTAAVNVFTLPTVDTRSIAVHPYLDRAFVASSGGTLLVLDTTTFTVVDSVTVGGSPQDMVVTPNGRWVFVSDDYYGHVTVVDAFDHAIETVVPNLYGVWGLEVAPDSSRVYAASPSGNVYVLDGNTFQVLTTVSGLGTSSFTLASTCAGDELFVAVYNAVQVVDTTSYLVTQAIPIPGYPFDPVLCPQFVAEGAILTPLSQTHAGARGTVVTHTFSIINALDHPESFNLGLGAHNWDSALSTTTVGPLATGEMAAFQVLVTVPSAAPWYTRDTVSVTATAAGDPTVTASAEVTTEANGPPQMSLAPDSLSSTQLAGQVTQQTLTISNGNGVTLTVELDDIDLDDALVRVAPLDLPRGRDVFPKPPLMRPDVRSRAAPAPVGPIPRVLAAGVLPSAQIQAGQYFTTTLDNENNYHTGTPDGDMDYSVCQGDYIAPIEFNILVDRTAAGAGVLTIRAYDVDSPSQADQVRVNGVYVGDLVGADGQWSETVFTVPEGTIVHDANLVEINIGSGWCVTVDWGELFAQGRPAWWLDENPSAATIASDSSQAIAITFDARQVQPGEHHAAIVIASNDPLHAEVEAPVTMTVQPTADMGRVAGAVTDAWTGLPLTATIELVGVYTMTARPNFEIWATAGAYALVASAPGYFTQTLTVAITAGGLTPQSVALEPALARLEWSPAVLNVVAPPGVISQRTLNIVNSGPVPLEVALFEINPVEQMEALGPRDLNGARILYDRAHGEDSYWSYSILVNDILSAGGTVEENLTFPVTAQTLHGVDILWVANGSRSWSFSEMNAIYLWLHHGGALLVQGGSDATTNGPASIYDIYYLSGSCQYGYTTNNLAPHAITRGVSSVLLSSTCWYLDPGPVGQPLVYDLTSMPHLAAAEDQGGKMVVVSSADFYDSYINSADNRLLGNNVMRWLARPAYTDVSWLRTIPVSGTLPGHSSLAVTVEFDTVNLPSGQYTATLAIEHNDPHAPFPVDMPITLTVQMPTSIELTELSGNARATGPTAPAIAVVVVLLLLAGGLAWRTGIRNVER